VIRALALAALLAAAPAAAQEAVSGRGGMLRILDKQTGAVTDVEIETGTAIRAGLIEVELRDCRYPVGNPAGDAFASLVIHYFGLVEPVFSGWMIASSPALNAMDHPRYDVWVLRCTTA